MKRFLCSLAVVAFGIISPSAARADSIAFSSPVCAGNQAWGGSLGLRFDVLTDIDVTKLGVFDEHAANSSSLASTLYAQIFDRTTQTAVSSVLTFTAGNTGYTLVGGDRFQSLASPLLLTAGFKGEIVAWGFDGAQMNGNRNTGWLPATTLDNGGGAIAFTDDASDAGPSAGNCPTWPFDASAYPGHPAGDYRTGWLAGTFQFVPVPEPTTISLLVLGGLALIRQWRRK